jgi:DNA-binding winged helix-turn-helix (wHTH) protein
MPPPGPARCLLTLDIVSGQLRLGGATARLHAAGASILVHLARHPHAAVPARDLALALGLRSAVDIVSAARQAVMTLRRDLRGIGLADVVVSEPRKGYRLDPCIEVLLLGVNTPGPAHRPPRTAGAVPAMACKPEAPGLPQESRIGRVDAAARCLWLEGQRLAVRTDRDFRLLAAIILGDGEAVGEDELARLCGYDRTKSGPELLRRAIRRLNAFLDARAVVSRIRPTAPAYGSPYMLAGPASRFAPAARDD